MNLKDILSVSGKGGLHKIVGRRPNGLIVEAMDDSKSRFPVTYNQKISILDDIAIYTMSGEERLLNIFVKMQEMGKAPEAKDDDKKLKEYFSGVLPDYDTERVYTSDIKKVIGWYNLLKDQLDFKVLQEEQEKEGEAASEEGKDTAEIKTAESKHPKTIAPRNTASKASSKSAGGAKTTYRPKSV